VPLLWPINLKWGLNVPTHFRALEQQGQANRKDEILRASVSAFVALSNPNRRDCNQIEDLALPILPFASEQTKRFICAALAENGSAPANLVRKLCDEPVEICAPLLLLSPVMSAIDLVAVIGRKGKHHARIIARRSHLPNDVIEALALVDDDKVRARAAGSNEAADAIAASNLKPTTAAQARTLLAELAMSLNSTGPASPFGSDVPETEQAPAGNAARLVRLALHEDTGLFATAVADATGLTFGKVQRLVKRAVPGELSTVLRALDISVDAAFVISCTLNPQTGANRLEIRLFRDRFEQLDQEKAVETLRRWKADEITAEFKRRAVNSDEADADDAALKA
jgi:uncharacterized protein (DUF2336 family)